MADPNTQETGTTTTPTFDELLKDPTFQAEFDRRVAKALKTTQDKAAQDKAAAEDLARQFKGLQTQVNDYQRRESAIKAGVDPRFLKFVAREVADAMTDGTDFDTALAAYVKDNPQYVAAPNTPPAPPAPPAGGWGQQQRGASDGAKDGVMEAFAKLNPNLKLE